MKGTCSIGFAERTIKRWFRKPKKVCHPLIIIDHGDGYPLEFVCYKVDLGRANNQTKRMFAEMIHDIFCQAAVEEKDGKTKRHPHGKDLGESPLPSA